MSLKTKELSILAAVAQQCAETRRPISSLIVMAACNARTGIEQDRVLVHLASLKRQGYVTQEGERWEVTPEGHQAARQHLTQAATPSQEPEPIPEKPPVRPKSRDTLRPRQLTAPRPVTRQESSDGMVCSKCGALPGQHHHAWCTAHHHEIKYPEPQAPESEAQPETEPLPGFLERRHRKTSTGKSKAFWCVTVAGTFYGKNVVSPESPRETQPHWYRGRFGELLAALAEGEA